MQIIKEEIARVNEAERGYEDPAALAGEEAQMARILRGGMLGQQLSKEEEERLGEIVAAGIKSGEYKDSNSPAGKALNDLLGSSFHYAYNVSAMINKRDNPADVAIEVMQKVYDSLEDFRGDSSFRTWLYTITKNKAIDAGRKSQKELETTDYSVNPEDSDVDSQIYPIRQKILDPLQTIIQTQEFEKYGDPIEAAIASLPEKDKKTFEQLKAFYKEKGLDLSDLSTGSEKYSKSLANTTEFGEFISPEGTNKNTAITRGNRALKSLEAALADAGIELGLERPVDESIEEAGGYEGRRGVKPPPYDPENPEKRSDLAGGIVAGPLPKGEYIEVPGGRLTYNPLDKLGKQNLEEIIAEVLSELIG